MIHTVFFIDRFLTFSVNIFNELQKLTNENKNYKIVFIGPDEKNAHWLSYHNVRESKKIWSRGDYFWKLYKYIKNERPDVVHFLFELKTFGPLKSTIFFPFLLYLISKSDTKIVVTIRNILLIRKEYGWEIIKEITLPIPKSILIVLVKLFIKLISNLSDKIMVETQESKLGLTEYYGIDKNKIEVTPLGVKNNGSLNLDKKKKIETRFNGKKIVLLFGIISPRKGHEVAIRSFKIIDRQLPDHILIIAGGTSEEFYSYKKNLEELIKNLNLQKKILFTGFLDDDEIDIYFELADIALFVYQPIVGASAALLYAIQHEVPSIVADSGTFKEFLGSKSAVYVDPNNEKQLADSIIDLATHSNLRNSIKTELTQIRKRLSWQNTAIRHFAVYTKLVEGNQ